MQNVLYKIKSFCERMNHDPEPKKESIFKDSHGEVHTPLHLVYQMLIQIPEYVIQNPYTKYLDTGAGFGNFSIVLFFILLKQNICEKHIFENMLHLVEINETNIKKLYHLFDGLNEITINNSKVKHNIYKNDFLIDDDLFTANSYDVIYGNPPYNVNGKIKVPTNNVKDKKEDGVNMWTKFVRRAHYLLKPNGILLYIIPSIWCKPDKAKIYDLFTEEFQILFLKFFTNSETNKLFSSHAQTPTCIVMAKKNEFPNSALRISQLIPIYDTINEHIISFNLRNGKAIPTQGIRIIEKMQNWTAEFGSLLPFIIKTSMPTQTAIIIPRKTITCFHENIHSAIICDKYSNIKKVELVKKYSDKLLPYSNKVKLVLPHKMFGIPFYDISGKYGISNRDNYLLILPDNLSEFYPYYEQFLKSKFVQFILSCSRYRMMVIEKNIFDYIPCIHRVIKQNRHFTVYPEHISNEKKIKMEVECVMKTIYSDLSDNEKEYINNNFSDYDYINDTMQ